MATLGARKAWRRQGTAYARRVRHATGVSPADADRPSALLVVAIQPRPRPTLGEVGEFAADRGDHRRPARDSPESWSAPATTPRCSTCRRPVLDLDRRAGRGRALPPRLVRRAADVGRKAVAVNVADIEAMGGRAFALVVGFSAPGDLPAGLGAGLRRRAPGRGRRGPGSMLVGGDVTRARDVTDRGHGARGPRRPAAGAAIRRPARTTSSRMVGRTGLGRGRADRAAAAGSARRGPWSRRYRVPEVPYGQGAVGRRRRRDRHDRRLRRAAGRSRSRGGGLGRPIDLRRDAFEVPEPLQAVAAATGTDPYALILTGGEDHALAAASRPTAALPPGWRVDRSRAGGRRRAGRGAGGRRSPGRAPAGWDHFGGARCSRRAAACTTLPTARVLTIAGSDSGGGAGIQADLKTMLAHRRARDERADRRHRAELARRAGHLAAARARRSGPSSAAWSTTSGSTRSRPGCSARPRHRGCVAELLAGRRAGVPVVRRPGLRRASTATALIDDDAVARAAGRLLPLATVITPNLPEAELLAGLDPDTPRRELAERLLAFGPAWVLVKGGHADGRPGRPPVRGRTGTVADVRRRRGRTTGTPTAPAARWPRPSPAGSPWATTCRRRCAAAKAYVTGAMPRGFPLGAGIGPTDHLWRLRARL